MEWWIWIVVALVLIVAEMFVPTGFVLLLVGIAFLLTGGSVAAGLSEPSWLPWAICVALMGLLITLLRRPMMRLFGLDLPSPYNEMGTEEIIATEEIGPGRVGQGEMRGTTWKLRNIGEQPLHAGERYKALRIDGLTVEVKS